MNYYRNIVLLWVGMFLLGLLLLMTVITMFQTNLKIRKVDSSTPHYLRFNMNSAKEGGKCTEALLTGINDRDITSSNARPAMIKDFVTSPGENYGWWTDEGESPMFHLCLTPDAGKDLQDKTFLITIETKP